MTEIKTILKDYCEKFNNDLERYFPQSNLEQHKAFRAMYYSLSNGGKRLRPFLLHKTAELFGVEYDKALPVAIALEMVHTYSLIHDDLPAMDNDDLRRGKPTCHKAFDEATAILAGDGLLTYAFEVLNRANIEDKMKVELTIKLSQLAGAYDGMIAGQVLDMFTESHDDFDNKESIIRLTQSLKTGCLLRFPCEAGAIIGNASPMNTDSLIKFAKNIGLAFQITDDILDVEGDAEAMGKPVGSDAKNQKSTYVSLYSLEGAKALAAKTVDEALQCLEIFGDKADALREITKLMCNRKN